MSKQPKHLHDTSKDMKLSIVMQTSDDLRCTTSGGCVIEDTAVGAIPPARAASIDSMDPECRDTDLHQSLSSHGNYHGMPLKIYCGH